MRRPALPNLPDKDRGIVLPMALIMLVIISFAGLLAARNSATFEQFSNNMRSNQVARVAAEDALRYCERVAIDSVDNGGINYATDAGKILPGQIADDNEATIQGASWNTHSNWAAGAVNLITVTPSYSGSQAQSSAQLRNSPSCIIQPMINGRFLVTTRGLSSDATVANDGTLSNGSEVWLQSILTPSIPVLSANNGVE